MAKCCTSVIALGANDLNSSNRELYTFVDLCFLGAIWVYIPLNAARLVLKWTEKYAKGNRSFEKRPQTKKTNIVLASFSAGCEDDGVVTV